MTKLVLSPAAQEDVEDIWNYTAENWGEEQAIRYTLNIRDACRSLADGSAKGRGSNLRTGRYRSLRVGSHVIYFKVDNLGKIDVVRVLHRRMDASRHL